MKGLYQIQSILSSTDNELYFGQIW